MIEDNRLRVNDYFRPLTCASHPVTLQHLTTDASDLPHRRRSGSGTFSDREGQGLDAAPHRPGRGVRVVAGVRPVVLHHL